MIGLKVPKNEANRIRLLLQEKAILDHDWKIRHWEDHVYLPLTQEPDNDFLEEIGLDMGNIVDTEFEEVKRRPRNMEDYLQGKIPQRKMEEFKKSFDIMGDVVILEIPGDLEEEK